MAYSVDWLTKIVTVPQADLTLVSAGVYELDVSAFWAAVHDIQDGEGMPYVDIMRSSAPVTLSGLDLARVVEVINGYRVEFEDGNYQVNLTGANNNILDARVQNQVSINANNSAGLIQPDITDQLAAALQSALGTVGTGGVGGPTEITYRLQPRAISATICRSPLRFDVARHTEIEIGREAIEAHMARPVFYEVDGACHC